MSEDFDVFQSLWSNINDTCAPAPPPGSDAVSCFLMEMPGFSINPKAFDPQSFNELESQEMSPDCAVARLCDRVPAVANYFYDTGNKISFYWNQLCTTYGSTAPEAQSARLKERYDSAIKALYGSQEGYINQEKTKLFQNVETLRSAWEEKQDELAEFKKTCQKDKKNWPGNYEKESGPLRDAVEEAHTEYNIVKMEIKHQEAAISAYETGDLDTMMLEQLESGCKIIVV